MEIDFSDIRETFDRVDEEREAIIKESRDLLKLSKHAIYSVHRGDLEKAKEQLASAAKIKARLDEMVKENCALKTGGYSSALAEYVEAATFFHFITDHRLATREALGVDPEEYLLGLADLTGELARRAVLQATKRNEEAVKEIHAFLEALYGQFVQFDFRNGELRRKYDSIKYNLQKVEQILYDLALQ